MKCKVCYANEATAVCDDCNKPVCEHCRADFPHHDPPHSRCENCYHGHSRVSRPKERDSIYPDPDWWKHGTSEQTGETPTED